MARVLLPCEVEEWWEDKRLFLLLSHMRTIKDFDLLISSHTRKDQNKTLFFKRLTALQGLRVFLANYCTVEQQNTFFTSTLPCIAKAASFLDERVPDSGIPFLSKQESAALVLGRKLVLSLVANAFLCTFPTTGTQSHIAPFNFDKFFTVFLQNDEGRMATQAAKLKCVLCYFQRVAEDRCNLSSVITLRRQSVPMGDLFSMEDWLANVFPLCPVLTEKTRGIEDCGTLTLQVDFANKKIGGGVLGGGRVQEEIRFCICPELLISRLIMDHMDPNEAIIITGVERFALHSGYGYTLKFDKEYVDDAQRDVFGNILTSIVAIDAVSMGNNQEKQYKLDLILRELNKAYVGYQCQQDRGDTSTELLALNVKRCSSAFVGEFTGVGQPLIPPASQQSALGNITLSHSLGSSGGSTPLSPIKELAEFPPNAAGESVFDDYAHKFTESLFGDLGLKKTSTTTAAAAPAVDEAPPTGGNLDDLASALSSSILEAAVGPCATASTANQRKLPPFTAADISAGGVDDLASALSSSILHSSTAPAADVKEKQALSLDEHQKPSTMNELVNSLSSSILHSTCTSVEKDAQTPPTSLPAAAPIPSLALNAESITKSIIADAVLSSSGVPPAPETNSQADTKTPPTDRVAPPPSLTLNAESITKSIIADALLSSGAPPAPKIVPPQTSGQSSDSITPATDAALGSLADQLTSSIISDVLAGPPAPNVILASQLSSSSSAAATSPSLNRPAIFIQVERRGSGGVTESPRSSRSSSLTGQTITLHEYTDELVESTCREGVAIALFQAQGQEVSSIGGAAPAGEGGGGDEAVLVEEGPRDNNTEGDKPVPSTLDKLFDSVVSTSVQAGVRQQASIEVEDEAQPASLSSDTLSSSVASTPRVVKQSPILSRHGLNLAGRKYLSLGSESGDPQSSSDDGLQVPSKLLLSTPSSSVMSYAWSTASTRDEDSRPVSPTNLDRIALDFTQDIDEFSNLLSKIIVSEVIATLTGIRGPRSKVKGTVTPDEAPEEERDLEDMNKLPTTTKIDVYLSRLDQASPLPDVEEVDEGGAFEAGASDGGEKGEQENDGGEKEERREGGGGGGGEVTDTSAEVTGSEVVVGAPYPSPWHQMRAMLLRPVATGNWGCGAFKGDPQLKSMLQWAATSVAGRPQMIYCIFTNPAVKQLAEVTTHLRRKKWTVGNLTTAILDYCKRTQEERKTEDLFTYLLKL